VEDVDVPDAEVVVVDELPPQAVATMHTATNATSHWKRFIDTLRSRFDGRQLCAGAVVAGSHIALLGEPPARHAQRGRS
jgi:phage terminase large subunit-like protein